MAQSSTARHLLKVADLTTAEIERIFAITKDLRTKYDQGLREPILPGRVLAMLFEKHSLRTRVSFEAGIAHLGGTSLFLGNDVGWGSREDVADFARVLSCYVDCIVIRAKHHASVVEFAKHSSCPVINGLTEEAHPCQALADAYTLKECLGSLPGSTFCYVGDANNMAMSLAEICARLGMHFVAAMPRGYQFTREFIHRLECDSPWFKLRVLEDPKQAVQGADVIYTDVWASMGQEHERAARQKAFADFQINGELMRLAPHAKFMHCLPARRGEEVTDEVIDGPQSVVVQQAANRMHVQKGILTWLLAAVAK